MLSENKNTRLPGKVLRLQEVLDLLSISKSYHFAKLDKNSKSYDPTYPKPISVGERSVRYIEQEVVDWVNARMEERNAS
ncbi:MULTISPECIES: helix-turn-helix transcriptional regulator [Idiomarina]|jgi:prophage regulatory protein|uniref:helix-turn-helix transcriptional regulator n=1 Tax=Idiomarina TaxID=135575 RepID=UPI00257EC874|nr:MULTISPECIES: AlpA family phage regulatory protein [unclassified Idiomarina]|tara:strand:- start:3299 stop:3535 length:237 start_codon:yes stop_codon:yes gene_type:complete